MNFAGHFDSKLSYGSAVALDGEHFAFDSAPGFAQQRDAGGVVVVPDAHLLFSGSYMRIGNDLIISGPESKFVVGNYFKGESRPTLASKDGATLSGQIVDALTGHVHYAQATAPAPAQVIGHVLKLTGSATVIRNGVSIELHIGDAVQKGDVVQTGADSAVGMTFIDGSAFGMTSNARMVLNEMIFDPNGSSNSSLISLVQGTITFVAGQTAKNGNMRVDTPVATMGIRGTAVLVEIGADDGPTKFSVLVEPDGHTGSYNLYDKASGQLIGTVSQAGQVTFVSSLGVGQGVSAVEQLKTMQDQQAEKAIIQQVFQLFFPNYNPDDSKPNTNKFGFSSGNSLAEIIITTMTSGDQTVISQIELHFTPPGPGSGDPSSPDVILYNTKATFSAKDIFLEEANGSGIETRQTFKIADLVHIDDPDIDSPPFYDIGVPFVPGSAVIKSATSSFAGLIPTLTEADLKNLLSIDQNTGQVSFREKDFDFLPEGQTVEYVIQVTASSGPDSAKLLIHVTVTGTNDAPTLACVAAPTLTDTAVFDTFDNLCGDLAGHDPDAGETASLTYAVLTDDGPENGAVAGLYGTLTVDSHGHYTYVPNAGAINALGEGAYQDVFTIVTTDVHGATGTATFTVNVEGADDAPAFDVRDQYVTESVVVRGFSLTHTFTLHDLIGEDVDAGGETFTLTASADHGTLALARNHDDVTVTGRNTAALKLEGTLDAINDALQGASDGLTYSAGLLDSRVEHVQLVLTDGQGLSDTLNFVFQQNSLASGSLTGGSGKDVIFSNLGNNVMTGGAGADTFVFDGLKGFDVITDFNPGEDRIVISDTFASFDDLLAHTYDIHGNAVIVSGLSSLTIAGIDKAHLTSSDFHIVA